MPKILFTLEASSPAEAKAMMERAYGEVPITDDDIRDYLVRKGWWKPGVENGPQRSARETGVEPGKKVDNDSETDSHPTRHPEERKNFSPGVSKISKIGSSTREALLDTLESGLQPDKKWSEHLKLLWSRHEIKFDGKEYYL